MSFPRSVRPAGLLLLLWLLAMIAVPIADWTVGPALRLRIVELGVVLQTLAVAVALRLSWKWRRIVVAAVTVAVLSLLAEAIGTATGWPFGEYVYTDRLQPQLLHVPLLIPLAWFMIVPPAWAVAYRLVERRLLFTAVSALAITSWDLFLDPQMTAWQLWEWQQPGRYFGIPLINYFGWFLVAFIISWLLYPLLARPLTANTQLLLLLIFTLTWMLELVGLALFWGQPGPAVAGGIAMGSFVIYGWLSRSAQGETAIFLLE